MSCNLLSDKEVIHVENIRMYRMKIKKYALKDSCTTQQQYEYPIKEHTSKTGKLLANLKQKTKRLGLPLKSDSSISVSTESTIIPSETHPAMIKYFSAKEEPILTTLASEDQKHSHDPKLRMLNKLIISVKSNRLHMQGIH